MRTRLTELGQLKDGWLDGEGIAPPAEQLDWFEAAWRRYSAAQPEPAIYPTLKGGLSLEWDGKDGGLDLELDVVSRKASGFQGDQEVQLDLGSAAGWTTLNDLLGALKMQA